MLDELERLFARDAAEELPPWLSRGIREAHDLGDAALPALRAMIDRESSTAFLALEALRAAGDSLTDTAHAFASLGPVAVEAVKPLLDDRRPALLEGSEEAMMSENEQYRVRDYAWIIASKALGRASAWSPDPATRDREIDDFGRWL